MHQESLQMEDWQFPQTIHANSEVKIYIEFSHRIYYWTWKIDQGFATYRVKEVGLFFTVKAIHTAHSGSSPDVLVGFQNFRNLENKVATKNWEHDKVVVFDLAYDRGSNSFYSKKLASQEIRHLTAKSFGLSRRLIPETAVKQQRT